MTSNSRRFLISAWACLVVGVLSACGGSSSTAGAPSGQPGAGSPPSTSASTADAQAFCAVVSQQRAVLQGTELAGLLTGGSPEAWKAYLDKTSAMNQQLVDAAPADIRASVKTLQDATVALQSTLAAANYDVSKVGATNLIKLLQSPERKDASTALTAYVKAHCAIDLTTLGG
jgi:hypothetical protein